MKRRLGEFALIAILITLLGSAAPAAAQSQKATSGPPTMSHWQARRIILAAFDHVEIEDRPGFFSIVHVESVSRGSIQFARDSIEFDGVAAKGRTRHYRIDLKTLQIVSSKTDYFSDGFYGITGKDLCRLKAESQDQDTRKLFGSLFLGGTGGLHGDALRNAAKALAAAFNRLHAISVDGLAVSFHQQAAAWRALATKPPLPDKARLQRLLAEDALKHRQPQAALNYYERGLEIYPTWPQGWFNAALVAGQLGYYSDAVEHMQNYLKLVPNAKDAKAARDQITIWQYKARQSSMN